MPSVDGHMGFVVTEDCCLDISRSNQGGIKIDAYATLVTILTLPRRLDCALFPAVDRDCH